MDHFLASQVDITYVLSLYPSIIVPNSTVLPEPEKVVDFGWDTSDLSRCSSGMSDEMDASPRAPIDVEENSSVQSKIVSHNTLMALIKFLQKKRYNIIEKAAAEGTDEAVSDAFSVNFRSYDSNRSKKSNRVSHCVHHPLKTGFNVLAINCSQIYDHDAHFLIAFVICFLMLLECLKT